VRLPLQCVGSETNRRKLDINRPLPGVLLREMATMSHLLLVDDDQDLVSLLTNFFRKHSHTVSVAHDGAAMFAELEKQRIDLVILDVMLQDEDGFSLCRRLRAKSAVPVIMLTAMADHTDRVVGLELGADDYLTKPFDQRELLARVKAVLRRTADSPAPSSRSALVLLSGGEFDLLLAFAEHPRRILTRDQLIDLARGAAHVAYDRSIDVQVSRLRYKLEQDPKNPTLIRTVRNGGYIFESEVTRR
jgi:two-component system, OmpR family, response regulator